MQATEAGAWGLDDGIKAPELDIVAICDVIREGLVHDVAEWKDTSIPASTKMPLVGWSFCAPVESESNGRGSKSAMHAFSKQEIQVRKICVEGGGPKACAKAGRCGAHGVPSLRSLALGYVAPFVADIAQETASSLPSNVRATLIALARQRHELTDAALISLVDESFASLDLHGCGHIRPTSLVGAIARLPLLRSLDISGCSFTSELVYSLPYSCPLLRVLRLSGCSTALIDLRAWQRLIPRVLPSTADTWEEEAPSRSRGLVCLRWLCWPDISPDIQDLFQRQWPKVSVNAHDVAAALPNAKVKDSLPPEALPWVCLDDGPAAAAAASAWRNLPMEDSVSPVKCRRTRKRSLNRLASSAASDEEFDEGELSHDVSKSDLGGNGCADAVLQRWMDAKHL